MTTRPSRPQVWIFPEGTTLEQGPLNFVPGSQHNSEAKLRRNLNEIYNSVDCVLVNHAIEVEEKRG